MSLTTFFFYFSLHTEIIETNPTLVPGARGSPPSPASPSPSSSAPPSLLASMAWHVAEVEISSPYCTFSREKVMGTLGVHIGLNSVNVTLKAMPISNQSSDIDYNKHFHWVDATQMKEGLCSRPPEGPPFPHPHCRRLHCGRQGLLLGKELPRGRLLHLNLPLDGFCSLGSLQPSPHRCPSIRRQPDDPHRVHLALLQLIY